MSANLLALVWFTKKKRRLYVKNKLRRRFVTFSRNKYTSPMLRKQIKILRTFILY